MKANVFGKGNVENINKIERHFNINLPNDYKEFLKNNNGAVIEDGYFYVNDLEQEIIMGCFYGVDLEEKCNSIIDVNEEYKNDILENSLLIGDDPGGAFILLVFDGNNDGIYYYDHSYFFEQSNDELNTYYVCESFFKFMEILKKDK